MSNYWETLAARSNDHYTEEDFETAAYRLVAEQVLYYSDTFSRSTYNLVNLYSKDFEKVLEPLGIELMVNSVSQYVYAKPYRVKNGMASVEQTLFALVLRQIYAEAIRQGDANDSMEVLSDLIEVEEKYKLSTGREYPNRSKFDAILQQLKRWGIARIADENDFESFSANPEGQPSLLIRPAIVDVLGDHALVRLGAWAQGNAIGVDAATESIKEDNNEIS